MKPIDEFFRDYLRLPLKAAGFKRKGRRFYLGSPLNDVSMVEVRSFSTGLETLTFWMKIALYPEPYRAWMDYPGEPEDAGWGMWCRQIGEGYYGDPDAPSTDPTFWKPLRLNAAEHGPFLTLTLERHVIPFLTAMLDRDRLLSAIKSGELTGLQAPFTVLADEGWTPDLLTELAKMSDITRSDDDQAEGVQRVGDFLRNRVPLRTPEQEHEFYDAVALARRHLPPLRELLVETVDTRQEHIRVGRRRDFGGVTPRHWMHAHLIATDGTVTPCKAGPADYEWDGETPFLIPITEVPADKITVGATLRISQYRTDEVDQTTR